MSNSPPSVKARRAPLSVRLNDQGYEILRQKAGNGSLSSYLKQAALAESAPSVRRRTLPTRDQRMLALILAAFGQSRLANNLNDLAKAAHSGSLPVDEETERNLVQACWDVRVIRRGLLMALGVETDLEDTGLSPVFNSAAHV